MDLRPQHGGSQSAPPSPTPRRSDTTKDLSQSLSDAPVNSSQSLTWGATPHGRYTPPPVDTLEVPTAATPDGEREIPREPKTSQVRVLAVVAPDPTPANDAGAGIHSMGCLPELPKQD